MRVWGLQEASDSGLQQVCFVSEWLWALCSMLNHRYAVSGAYSELPE